MGITVRVKIAGAREMLRAFKRLPKDASRELREANREISKSLAGKIRTAASASSAQSAAVAPSIRAQNDRVPSVTGGGRRRATSQRRVSRGQDPTTAGDLIFGANFGATYLPQFRPQPGDDYWFFRTVEQNMPAIEAEWIEACDTVLRKWAAD